MSDDRLPRLVFFRRVDPNLPEFIRLHLRQQVDCLSRWFDVVVIGDDCDYAEICDRYEPDMALFESGVYAARRTIANTDANPRVPKLGFLHSDAYCVSRTVFMSDMQRWGVDEFVTISVAMGEYTPEIADRLFVWPNFVDDLLYRDHGLPKAIPVLFTGSQAVHYPWRNRVSRVVSANYPTLTAPHLGWFDQRAAARMVHGERYARMLNAAYTVPTCGTIAKDLVRKHLEIPAAAACLVTERTAAVEAAGFVDMDSCVFADEDTVLDKLDHLFAHPDELARITAAGHDLVHRRHTAARRDEIRQWYDLKTGLRPGQRIVQPGPFQRLVVADASGPGSRHVISGGVDRLLLREAARAESTARYADAEHLYRRCLNFHFMAEPLLGLARCRLYAGDPQAAIEWLVQPLDRVLRPYGAADPDPVEWAYFVRAQLCAGAVGRADRYAVRFPALRHPELDRIRYVVAALAGRPGTGVPGGPARPTVHHLSTVDFPAWQRELVAMLRACGSNRLARKVSALRAPVVAAVPVVPAPVGPPPVLRSFPRRVRRRLGIELRRRVRRRPAPDPIASALQELGLKEEVNAAVLVGASTRYGPGAALREGLAANPRGPLLRWITGNPPEVRGADRRVPLEVARREEPLEAADLLAVLDPAIELTTAEVTTPRVVVVAGLDTPAGHAVYRTLTDDGSYLLSTHDPSAGAGYAVFRKSTVRSG